MPLSNHTDINLRGEIEDLINRPPGWLLRSGIMTVAIVVVFILGMSALIEYPEKIIAQGVMKNSNAPSLISVDMNGVVDSVFSRSGEKIAFEQPIIAIQLVNDVQIITAPISGTLKMRFTVKKGVKVRAGETIGMIEPEARKSESYSIANIPSTAIETISIGDYAIIKIPSGSSMPEIIEGEVTKISDVGIQDLTSGLLFYELRIDLSNITKVTEVPSIQPTPITAEIFTDRKSVLERILSEFLNLVNR